MDCTYFVSNFAELCMSDLVNIEPSVSSFPWTKKLAKEIIRRIKWRMSYKRILDYQNEKMMIQVFRKICNHEGQYFSNQSHSIGDIKGRLRRGEDGPNYFILMIINYWFSTIKCWQNCAKYQKSIDANLIRLIGRRREGRGWICSVDVDTGNKIYHWLLRYKIIVKLRKYMGFCSVLNYCCCCLLECQDICGNRF